MSKCWTKYESQSNGIVCEFYKQLEEINISTVE